MELLSYVNIKQGTDSTERLSRGNTLPLVQKPFGFSSVSPQTNGERAPWFYSPRDRSFEGYRFTHQPSSPWINERGALVVSVATEEPSGNPFYNWSPFDENKTVLTPYYLY